MPGPGPHLDREGATEAELAELAEFDAALKKETSVLQEEARRLLRDNGQPPTSADVPVPTDAQKAIAGAQALVAKHEADGGTVKPVGDNAERLFGEDRKRAPLEEIADDAKAKAVESPKPTREELDTMIRADEDARAKACRKAIVIVCREHNCQLTAVPTFDPMIDGGFSVGASPVIRAL